MNAFFDNLRQLIQSAAESGVLPESLAFGFVTNALLAGLIIGPVLGGLGTLVVVKRFAFFSEAVGHAALTGVAIGILLGEPYTGPYGSLFSYCLIFGILLNFLSNRTRLTPDTLIGVFLSVSLALGASLLLVLAGRINIHILENVLFGSVLTVNSNDLSVLTCVAVLALARRWIHRDSRPGVPFGRFVVCWVTTLTRPGRCGPCCPRGRGRRSRARPRAARWARRPPRRRRPGAWRRRRRDPSCRG